MASALPPDPPETSATQNYRALFDSIDEGFCTIEVLFDEHDRPVDYRFLEVNPAFARHTGIEHGAGMRVREIAPNLEEHWFENYGRVAKTGESIRFEGVATEFGRYYDVNAFRIGEAGEGKVGILFTDITERKRREQDQQFLVEISDQLVAFRDIATTMERLGEKIGRHFQVTRCLFTELSEDCETSAASYGWHAPGARTLERSYRLRDFLSDEQFKACQEGEPTVVDDTFVDRRFEDRDYEALNIRSFVIMPLVREDQWRFMLSVTDREPREWRADEVELLREVTARIWARLERARAEEALRENEAWFAGQKDAFKAAVNGASLEKSLGELVETAQHQMGEGARCAFYLTDASGTELHHLIGMPETYAAVVDGFKVSPTAPACGAAVHTGLPVITPDVNEDPLWEPWRWLAAQHDFRACWSFPVEPTSGKVLGTLAMYFSECRDVTPRDLEFASAMTRAAAIIISRHLEANERAHAEEELKRTHEELEARVETRTHELSAALDRLTAESTERRRLEEERHQLLERVVSSQEEERARISRELHDNLSQHMVMVKMGLDTLKRDIGSSCGEGCEQAAASLAELSQRVDELIGIAHRQAWEFRPSELDYLGLEVALQHYASVWAERTGTEVEWECSGWDDLRLSPAAEIALYRVVQEALTNVARHAQASRVRIELHRNHRVTVSIADNGIGFVPNGTRGRLGIVGMRERMTLLGGTLEIEASEGGGTKVIARLPGSTGRGENLDDIPE